MRHCELLLLHFAIFTKKYSYYLHTFFGSSIQEKELSVRRTLIGFLTRNKAKTNKHSRALEYILALIRYFLVLYLSISLESTTTYSSGH